jgi:hypothetical protein
MRSSFLKKLRAILPQVRSRARRRIWLISLQSFPNHAVKRQRINMVGLGEIHALGLGFPPSCTVCRFRNDSAGTL